MAQRRLPNSQPESAGAVGLPQRPFLYTLDQIATLLASDEQTVRASIHYEGRSVGARPVKKMLARNIRTGGWPNANSFGGCAPRDFASTNAAGCWSNPQAPVGNGDNKLPFPRDALSRLRTDTRATSTIC